MAVIKQYDPNAKQTKNLQTIATAAPVSPSMSSTPTGPTTPTGSPGQPQQQGSGRFTNIQKYLDANQGAGQKLSSNIQGQVGKQAEQISQNIAANQARLQTQVNPLQANLGEQGSQQLQQGFQDPNAILSDQQKLAQFRNLQQGYGTDIQNIQGTQGATAQQLQSQLSQLSDTTGLAGSEAGRFQLLRQAINPNNPGYTQGQQRLDQVFLQSQPGVGRDLQASLKGLSSQQQQNLTQAQEDQRAKLNALRTMSGQRQEEWKNLLQGGTESGIESDISQRGLGDIEQSIKSEYENISKTAPELQEAIRQGILNNTISNEQLQSLGIGEKGSNKPINTWGLSGQDILNAGGFQANALSEAGPGGYAQVATPEEFNRYNALNKLAGDQTSPSIFGASTEVGTYKPISFNEGTLQEAINARKKAITETNFQNALNSIDVSNPNIAPLISNIKERNLNPEQAKAVIDTFLQALRQGDSINFNSPDVIDQIIGGTVLGPVSNLGNLLSGGNIISGGMRNRRYSPEEVYAANAPYFNPFNQYYNQQYIPASTSLLGQNVPEATPLPSKNDGSIDWSQITTPTGSAGKYQ